MPHPGMATHDRRMAIEERATAPCKANATDWMRSVGRPNASPTARCTAWTRGRVSGKGWRTASLIEVRSNAKSWLADLDSSSGTSGHFRRSRGRRDFHGPHRSARRGRGRGHAHDPVM
jgi:hypothetical protein